LGPVADLARETIRWMARGVLRWVQGLGGALLPSPERERFARPRELDVARSSFALGVVQGFAGVGLFLFGGLAVMRPATTEGGMVLLENWFPGLSTTHFQGLALLNWLAWMVLPISWPFTYLAFVGLARCAAFAVTREAIGEPLVWAALRAGQAVGARFAARRRVSRLGPLRPDRVLCGRGPDLFVVSCREKPEWTAASTIEIGGRFYRLIGAEERPDGAWTSVIYRLREAEIGAGVIRRLVRYSPPPGTSLPDPPTGPTGGPRCV
jgi:hypothetical protein